MRSLAADARLAGRVIAGALLVGVVIAIVGAPLLVLVRFMLG